MTKVLEIVGTDIRLEIGDCSDCPMCSDCELRLYCGLLTPARLDYPDDDDDDLSWVSPRCPLPEKVVE